MIAKDKAKEIVNSFYQPLGMIKEFQKLNSKQMWKYTQDVAKSHLTTKIFRYDTTAQEMEELNQILYEIDNV